MEFGKEFKLYTIENWPVLHASNKHKIIELKPMDLTWTRLDYQMPMKRPCVVHTIRRTHTINNKARWPSYWYDLYQQLDLQKSWYLLTTDLYKNHAWIESLLAYQLLSRNFAILKMKWFSKRIYK